jgi:hypothetical protein
VVRYFASLRLLLAQAFLSKDFRFAFLAIGVDDVESGFLLAELYVISNDKMAPVVTI